MKKFPEEIAKKRIRIPIYGGTVTLIITNDPKQSYSRYNIKDDDTPTVCDTVDHRNNSGHQRIYVIFNSNPKHFKKYSLINTLGHELGHVANAVAKYRGLSKNFDEDEHMGYFQGYLLEQMYKFVEKYIV